MASIDVATLENLTMDATFQDSFETLKLVPMN